MRTPFEIVLLICLVLLISPGCARTVYKFSRDMAEKEYLKNDSAFELDVYECEQPIDPQYAVAPIGAAGEIFFEQEMNRCLGDRGWSQTPNGEYAYYFNKLKRKAVIK